MAKRNLGGKRVNQASASSSAVQSQTVQATPQTQSTGVFDDNYAAQLRQKYDDNYEPDVVSALKIYTSTKTDSKGFSPSQNLNYALDNKLPIDTKTTEGQNIKHMDRYLHNAMHDIGIQTTLKRACHDDVLQKLGIKDYTKMTEKQLKQKLIGVEYDSKAYTSYAYDDNRNPFLTGPQSGGREVIMKTTTKPTTKMLFGNKKKAEVIMDKGLKHRITNVYFSGKTATPRNKSPRPVVVIEVDMV